MIRSPYWFIGEIRGDVYCYRNLMWRAWCEAMRAFRCGEAPVGAVVAVGDELICALGNRVKRDNCSTAHAELLVIQEASCLMGTRDLSRVAVYTTTEPCPMCMGAIAYSRVGTLIYGTTLEDAWNLAGMRWRAFALPVVLMASRWDGQSPAIISGFMKEECRELLIEHRARELSLRSA